MAEFCLQCLNRINKTNDPESKYIISKDLELCEGCGKMRHIVVAERNAYSPIFSFMKRRRLK